MTDPHEMFEANAKELEAGWIAHDGGPNPVLGQRVEVRHRDGLINRDVSDVCWWSHSTHPDDQPADIIAYRVVTPAPAAVEGLSSSEGKAGRWNAACDAFYEATTITRQGSVLNLDVGLRAAIAALQPSSAADAKPVANPSEQTVRVLAEAHKTIRSGAPGLSDQTCNVLAGIIARKVSIIYAQPHPSQQAGAEGDEGREAIWKLVHEVWQLLDDAETDSAGVTTPDQQRWQAVSEAMDALETLVPDSEGPTWGGYPVNYLWPKGAAK